MVVWRWQRLGILEGCELEGSKLAIHPPCCWCQFRVLVHSYQKHAFSLHSKFVCHLCRWTGGWVPVLTFNFFLIVYFTTIGFGIGGYSSIRTLVDKVQTLGLFTACYQCAPAKKG